MATPTSRDEILRQLRRQLAGPAPATPAETVSCGCADIDRMLPGGGLQRGTLVEWLAAGEGSGAAWLALLAAGHACRVLSDERAATAGAPPNASFLDFREPRPLVVIDEQRDFYPPAAVAAGWDLQHLVVLRPATPADSRWAWDQALRCRGVAAVLGWPRELSGRIFRRWQLAAEAGRTLGLIVRPAEARGEPSWADLRWLVQPVPLPASPECSSRRRWRLEILRCRGEANGRVLEIEYDDEANALRLVSAMEKASPLPDRTLPAARAPVSRRRNG